MSITNLQTQYVSASFQYLAQIDTDGKVYNGLGVLAAISASTAATASYINSLKQDVQITGSLFVSGSQTFIGTKTITGSVFISGSKTVIGTNTITGSLRVSGGITGSLFGTASYVIGSVFTSTNPALTASFASSIGTLTQDVLIQKGGGATLTVQANGAGSASLILTALSAADAVINSTLANGDLVLKVGGNERVRIKPDGTFNITGSLFVSGASTLNNLMTLVPRTTTPTQATTITGSVMISGSSGSSLNMYVYLGTGTLGTGWSKITIS